MYNFVFARLGGGRRIAIGGLWIAKGDRWVAKEGSVSPPQV